MTVERVRKLSAEQVAEAVRRYEAGDQVKAIAADLGVSSSAISYRLGKATVLRRDRGAAGIVHGTRKGYQAHRALGLSPCEECREANRAAAREYAARRRAAA